MWQIQWSNREDVACQVPAYRDLRIKRAYVKIHAGSPLDTVAENSNSVSKMVFRVQIPLQYKIIIHYYYHYCNGLTFQRLYDKENSASSYVA